MKNNWNYKVLLVAAFFNCVTCFAVAGGKESNSQKNNRQAPEATAEEAKITHWEMPEIERKFWDIPELKKAFIDPAPAERKDGIPVGKLGTDGGNKKMIMILAQEIADKKHSEVDSMLIAHKGKVLFESYYSRGRVDLSHPQSSTTKSYTSLALGRAIALGYLSMADLDKPVASFLKELNPTKFVEGVDKITLYEALTMRGGLRLSDDKWKELEKKPAALKGQGQIQALFEHSAPITAEPKKFAYGNFNPVLVMQVIEAVVPGSAEDFIKKELLGKMGITNYSWLTAVSGLPASGWRMSITSRDMVKIGTLVMNKGKWNGKQLIPEAFIQKATNRNVHLSDEQIQDFYSGDNLSNSGYGYFWWQVDMKVGNKNYLSKSAQGGGGVTIIVIDELDLVVVITAHSRQAFLQMVAERVLPAFIK